MNLPITSTAYPYNLYLRSESITGRISVDRHYSAIYHHHKDGIIDIDRRLKGRSDFFMCRIEEDVLMQDCVPPSRQTPYILALIKKGKGVKNIGFCSFDIKNYTLFIVPRRMIHSSKCWSPECSGYIINFNIDFFLNKNFPAQHITSRKTLRALEKPYLYLDKEDRSFVCELFDNIFHEYQWIGQSQNDMLAIKLLELLICCDRLFQSVGQIEDCYHHPVIEKFAQLVESNYREYRNVQWYADQLCVHPNHLNYVLKKYSGINAKETIKKCIILESKCLLMNTNLIIKDIAHCVGFDDPNNFSTFFQKITGRSPVCFREMNAGKAQSV